MIALLTASKQFFMADLFTLTMADASVYRWTSADFDVVSGGNTWIHTGPILSRDNWRQGVGLQVDTMKITLGGGSSFLFLGVSLGLAAIQGAFDGARVKVERAFMGQWGDTSLGTVFLFEGPVAACTPSSTGLILEVKSELDRLNAPIPRNLYMPQCSHQLFDAGCALVRATFAVTGSVAGSPAPTATQIATSLTNPDGYYQLGWIQMTSGGANGQRRAIKAYTNANGLVTVALPFTVVPQSGNTFTALPGCAKDQNTCNTKFSNLVHFAGLPYVPKPETMV